MKYNDEDNGKGILRETINGVEYTFWTYARVVRKYIKDDLKKRFPGKLIIRELNQVDLSIPGLNLPAEIESTKAAYGRIRYAEWENRIHRQIDQNIASSGRCLLYFDEALLRAMKNAGRGMSINMDWFRKHMKEEKLEVFTVTYNGIIEPRKYEDFDFLEKVSQTSETAAETDDMILNRNKMQIFADAVENYGFAQDEIDRFDADYEESCKINKTDNYIGNFLIKQTDERSKIYGYIWLALGNLPGINQLLSRTVIQNRSTSKRIKMYARILGIFDTYGNNQYDNITKFVDRFDICKYFPGYLRNKETWEMLKGHNLNSVQFNNIIAGKTDVTKGIECCLNDYYNKENIAISNKEESVDKEISQIQIDNDKGVNIKIDNDKGVNIKIDNNDQIININIKTKQKSIEDAWS